LRPAPVSIYKRIKRRPVMSMHIPPVYAYRSEHKQTWIENSIKLGEQAADGDAIAGKEILSAVIDYDNVHKLRHSHLALLTWYAMDPGQVSVTVLKGSEKITLDSWEYCREVLLKPGKKSGFDHRLSDPWVASSMIFTLGKMVQRKKLTERELVDFICSENQFAARFNEQGILPALLEAFPSLNTSLKSSPSDRDRLCETLYNCILEIPLSVEYVSDMVSAAARFTGQLLKNSAVAIDPGADNEEKKHQSALNKEKKTARFSGIVADIKTRLESAELVERQNYYAFLLAEVIEHNDSNSINVDLLYMLDNYRQQCGVPDWNTGSRSDSAVYRRWISESISLLQDDQLTNKWVLNVVVPKAIRELSGKPKEILPLIQRGIRELGIGSNAVFPFLRGLKVNYQEQRLAMEHDISRQLQQFTGKKSVDPTSALFIKLDETLGRCKRMLGFQVYYAVKLTRTFQSIHPRFFKEIPTIIIECLQSAWMVFSEIESVFTKHRKVLNGSGSEIGKIIQDRFYREFYKLVYRILSSHMQTRIFKTMKDFCMVPEIGSIISLYEQLSEYYNLNETSFNEVISRLDDQFDYLPDSLRIYPFLQIDIEHTYEAEVALSRIIIEKSTVDFMDHHDIEEQLVDDIYVTENAKIKIETENRVLLVRDIIDDWTNIREDLYRHIEMDYGKRIDLLQKSSVLLGRLNDLFRDLLPTPAYFVHAWIIKMEQKRCDTEIEMVKLFLGKKEKEIAVMVDQAVTAANKLKKMENPNMFVLEYHQMSLALCYQYATRTIQKPLAEKLRGFTRLAGDYIRKYTVSFKNRFHYRFNTIVISGILLTVGIGYIAPFITGGNNDFWDFFIKTNWLSIIICMVFMMVMCRKKINDIVRNKVGMIDDSDIYADFSIKRRARFLFRQGQFFAYVISLLGLLIWHPEVYRLVSVENIFTIIEGASIRDIMPVWSGFSWKEVLVSVEPVAKYLVAFPYVALFIGLFLEKQLED
jgi:hypothetical protein